MTEYSSLTFQDLLTFNTVNLDQLTETYSINFYGEYLTHWPEYQRVAKHPHTGYVMGYILGKAEGDGEDWHGHVSAVTVGSTYRRLGLAEQLMQNLEDVSERVHNAYFVDLFVRRSNQVAQVMYKKLKYSVYREVQKYYQAAPPLFPQAEDAFDMRKGLARHKERSKSALIPLSHPIRPEDLEWH
jgi:N-terminal acetyltransferase B complex catalytic subunit